MEKNNKVISSHIFIFPFRWDYIYDSCCLDSSIDKRLNVERVLESLKYNKWKDDTSIINNDSDYNKYIYFYDNVRNSIYGKNNTECGKKENKFSLFKSSCWKNKSDKKEAKCRIVQCLKYDDLGKNPKYDILIGKETYSLKVKHIKLKVYDTGVANLIFFLDNYEYETEEEILNINDYGRRIYPQYLPLEKVKNSFLATELSLKISGKPIQEKFEYDYKKEPNRISKTILELLGDNFKCNKENLEKGDIFISPVIDDRMFTMCIYRNSRISESIKLTGKKEYINKNFWYQYIFIDNGYPTCNDKGMFKELLKKSTYTRWENHGTLYGISRYSFVVLIDETENTNFLMSHFNNMYYEMVLLTLTQRASILRFSDEISKISTLSEKDALINVKKLQKYYIQFSNNIYFREVTAQEQGIELYNKLTEMMEIESDIKRLGEEIDDIYKYTSIISNESTSNILNVIAYLGIGLNICNFVISLSSKMANNDVVFNLIWFSERTILPIAITLILFEIINYYFKCGKIKLLSKTIKRGIILAAIMILALKCFY